MLRYVTYALVEGRRLRLPLTGSDGEEGEGGELLEVCKEL